ncbi:hypothetical protein Tco_0059440, partial [Tanacetum coccineum]
SLWDESSHDMVRHVMNNEVKQAMFSISDDRAPGPDGIIGGINEVDVCSPPRCAFKVDIQKAYDTVDWKFLGKRGLRQGGLISPYLFTLVMEVLTLIIKRKVRGSNNFRYHNHCEEMQIVNIRFAYDLFIFARGELDSARLIMESLDEFQKSSGLVPSIPKSTTYFCNVRNHVKHAILNLMPFAEGELPVKYLGVPLISTRLLNRDCKILVERVLNRIGDWKNKSLSFAGCLQLCKFVISSMHVYWALDLVIPKVLVDLQLDMPQWRDINGNLLNFSIKCVWEALRPLDIEVPWHQLVWFSHCIPHHAFNLWLIMRNSLKTHDQLRQWDVGVNNDLLLLCCTFCDMHPDFISHLFFECRFSSQIWLSIRPLACMENVLPRLEKEQRNKKTWKCARNDEEMGISEVRSSIRRMHLQESRHTTYTHYSRSQDKSKYNTYGVCMLGPCVVSISSLASLSACDSTTIFSLPLTAFFFSTTKA